MGMSVISGTAFTALKGKGNLPQADLCEAVDQLGRTSSSAAADPTKPFLRIPPFPGSPAPHFERLDNSGFDGPALVDRVRRSRVGGTYWAAQPELPSTYVLVRSSAALKAARASIDIPASVCWSLAADHSDLSAATLGITHDCDPWHMAKSASAVVVEVHDELRLVASVLGIPTYLHDPRSGEVTRDSEDPEVLLAAEFGSEFRNPFTGEPMSAAEAIDLCGFWRHLIDSNRDVSSGLGFAFWKQKHVAPLLWNGSKPIQFVRSAAEARAEGAVAVWRSKVGPQDLAELDRSQTSTIEVEDGFLRSQGLGADCVPPLSITVDRLGAHFDPSRPSALEHLLETSDFDRDIVARAADLRRLIVAAGLGKYERGGAVLDRPGGDRRHILVPGQVEDDRAVITGGCGLTSNLELLKRVRERAPDAYILYKPHPDVLAGHRRGLIPDRLCLGFADQVAGEFAIGSLIAMVDEVHVNTSLAGFEALLRGKQVTAYGVPFYAGWGLTTDLGPVPDRRNSKRTLDELVAATLLLYPRYLDPVTGLPCPAEVVVARLCATDKRDPSLLVGARRLQGKFMRRLRSLVQ